VLDIWSCVRPVNRGWVGMWTSSSQAGFRRCSVDVTGTTPPVLHPSGFDLSDFPHTDSDTTHPHPHHQSSCRLTSMGLATYTATWAAIGFGIRCYQLGVMQRPLFTSSVFTSLSVYYLGSCWSGIFSPSFSVLSWSNHCDRSNFNFLPTYSLDVYRYHLLQNTLK
jgi:hypothetical protein